jgi:hypothetical protein
MGVALMGVHLWRASHISVHVMGVHVTSVHPLGVHLIGVHIMGVHPTGVYMGVPLTCISWAYIMKRAWNARAL